MKIEGLVGRTLRARPAGLRAAMGMAVRAGIRHIQFAEPTAGQVEAIEAYLRSLRPVPSPALDAARAVHDKFVLVG